MQYKYFNLNMLWCIAWKRLQASALHVAFQTSETVDTNVQHNTKTYYNFHLFALREDIN